MLHHIVGLDFANVRLFFDAGAFPPDMAILHFCVLALQGVGVFTIDVVIFWRGVGPGPGLGNGNMMYHSRADKEEGLPGDTHEAGSMDLEDRTAYEIEVLQEA
jgi:glucokinase